jgi:uncharacterized protein (DUF2336 family)
MDTLFADVRGVNILDSRQLLELAQDTTHAGRTKLAQAVSNFFDEQQLSAAEQRLASDILLSLIRQAEVDLREALADRLAAQVTVPHELIVFLANDETSVAAPVLLHSPLLSDLDLMYIIATRKGDHARMIAQRQQLSPMVADKLIDTRDPSVILTLIDNQRAHLQKGSMKKLVKAALVSEEIQAPLLRRPEIDAEIAVELYMVVAHNLRHQLTDRFNLQSHLIDQSVDHLIQELSNEAQGLRITTPEMSALARRLHERQDITADLLIRTLRRGQAGFFMALMAARLQVSPETVRAMIQKDGGCAFVFGCKAMGMLKSEFASIFLLSRGIRSGDKIVDQRELATALRQFDQLKDSAAGRRALAEWLPDVTAVA